MRRKLGTVALASSIGLAGVGVGVVVAPAIASAATSDTSAVQAVGDRASRIAQALSGLVKDGTITQAQADKVASTLDTQLPAGRGGGRGLADAAAALGLSVADLRTQLQAGKSLADVAQDKGVALDTLIDKLVAAEQARLAEQVQAGRLTQAQADQRSADLRARIAAQVQRAGLAGHGDGPGRHGRGDRGMGELPQPTPSATS